MQKLKEHLKQGGQLHHFYVIVGDPNSALAELENLCEETLSFSFSANQNFVCYQFDNLLVDEAKSFAEQRNRRVAVRDIHISVLLCQNITREAQNSLLKTLEEPARGEHIFLIIPSVHLLLPTVLSRAVVSYVSHSSSITKSDSDDVNALFKDYSEIITLSYQKRLELVKKILEAIKKEKIEKSAVATYIFSLVRKINEEFLNSEPGEQKEKLAKILPRVNATTQFATFPSASIKSILEYLMLTIRQS